MEVYIIDSILNLMLPCVELTNIILCNDESQVLLFWILLYMNQLLMTLRTNLKICTNNFDEIGLQ